jgi:hypothetical protein
MGKEVQGRKVVACINFAPLSSPYSFYLLEKEVFKLFKTKERA